MRRNHRDIFDNKEVLTTITKIQFYINTPENFTFNEVNNEVNNEVKTGHNSDYQEIRNKTLRVYDLAIFFSSIKLCKHCNY